MVAKPLWNETNEIAAIAITRILTYICIHIHAHMYICIQVDN